MHLLLLLLFIIGPGLATANSRIRHASGRPHHRGHHGPASSLIPRLDACYDPALTAHGFSRERFPACAVLHAGHAQLYWHHEASANQITLGVVMRRSNATSTTTGSDDGQHRWYALGLSIESQGMKGMDMAMLRPAGKGKSSDRSNGGWVLEDRWATDYAVPALDASQDKTLLSVVSLPIPGEQGLVQGLVVAFTFRMPLASCGVHAEEHEQEDASILPGRDTFVLWAQGVLDGDSGLPQYHGEDSGATRLPLGRDTVADGTAGGAHRSSGNSGGVASDKGTAAAAHAVDSLGVALPEDAQFLKVTLPEMEIPADETKYFCVYVQPPREAKYHIYSARQVGDAGIAKELVHHIGLYAAGTAEPPNPVGEPFDCTVQAGADHGLPIMIIDRGDVSTPSPHAYEAANASMPFGKDYDAYWLLEVHYNNPTNKAGLRDATGLVITYSPTLRQHDVGVLVLGAPPHVPQIGFVSPLIIPGGQPSFDYMNYCPGACTRRRFQQQQQQQHSNTTDEFHILYAHIHMHGLGRGGELQLIRNASGAADGWHRTRLLHRKHWDFEHQNGVAFAPPGLPLRPGDSFLTRCHYDSSGKNVTTIYGQSASDEMCLGLLFVRGLDTSVVCVDWEGAHSPGIDALGLNDPGKPNQVALCQEGKAYAQMVAGDSKETTTILTQRGGLVGGPRAEMVQAKRRFDEAPPLEEAVCGVAKDGF